MSREGRPQVFRQTGLVEELDEFLPLAIGEGVHRVDHDSPGAPLFAGGTAADRRINDRLLPASSRDFLIHVERTLGFSATGCFRAHLGKN